MHGSVTRILESVALRVKAFNSSDFLVLILSEIGLESNFYSHESEHNSLIELIS